MNKKKVKRPMGKKEMRKTKGGFEGASAWLSSGAKRKAKPEPELGPTFSNWLPNRKSTTQMEK